MPVKPHEAEEEYFARLEFERKKKLADEQMKLVSEEEKEDLQKAHYMHCPKCSMELIKIEYKQVEIDQCPNCKGFWIDADALDRLLLYTVKGGFLPSVLRIFSPIMLCHTTTGKFK